MLQFNLHLLIKYIKKGIIMKNEKFKLQPQQPWQPIVV